MALAIHKHTHKGLKIKRAHTRTHRHHPWVPPPDLVAQQLATRFNEGIYKVLNLGQASSSACAVATAAGGGMGRYRAWPEAVIYNSVCPQSPQSGQPDCHYCWGWRQEPSIQPKGPHNPNRENTERGNPLFSCQGHYIKHTKMLAIKSLSSKQCRGPWLKSTLWNNNLAWGVLIGKSFWHPFLVIKTLPPTPFLQKINK